jgi:hypothetical protein
LDDDQFDALTRTLQNPGSRRRMMRRLFTASGILGLIALPAPVEAKRRKKKRKSKKKRRQASPSPAPLSSAPPVPCGATFCSPGQVCCPDQKCGARCCANGRACNVTCSGPNGNDYCCDVTRPVAICGGCWQSGSTQCDGYCCGPDQKCCGDDHCCGDGYECVIGCGGVAGSATCCKGGQSPTCCPDGTPA